MKYILAVILTIALLPIARIGPQSTTLLVGTAGNVNVAVRNVTNLYAVDVHVYYDPTMVRVTKVTPLWGVISEKNHILLWSKIDYPGHVWHVVSDCWPEQQGFTGSGMILSLAIKPLKRGTSELHIEIKGSDADGNLIQFSVINGSVTGA